LVLGTGRHLILAQMRFCRRYYCGPERGAGCFVPNPREGESSSRLRVYCGIWGAGANPRGCGDGRFREPGIVRSGGDEGIFHPPTIQRRWFIPFQLGGTPGRGGSRSGTEGARVDSRPALHCWGFRGRATCARRGATEESSKKDGALAAAPKGRSRLCWGQTDCDGSYYSKRGIRGPFREGESAH